LTEFRLQISCQKVLKHSHKTLSILQMEYGTISGRYEPPLKAQPANQPCTAQMLISQVLIVLNYYRDVGALHIILNSKKSYVKKSRTVKTPFLTAGTIAQLFDIYLKILCHVSTLYLTSKGLGLDIISDFLVFGHQ